MDWFILAKKHFLYEYFYLYEFIVIKYEDNKKYFTYLILKNIRCKKYDEK